MGLGAADHRILAMATGAGLIAGNMAARVVGIVLAVVSAILNLAFIPAYPVWSVVSSLWMSS